MRKNLGNYSGLYGVYAGCYRGEEAATYFKITIPSVDENTTEMIHMEVSMPYEYSNSYFAKMFIRIGSNYNNPIFSSSCVSVISNDADIGNKIAVYYKQPDEIYIKSISTYSVCAINNFLVMDNMRFRDLTDMKVELYNGEVPSDTKLLKVKKLIIS